MPLSPLVLDAQQSLDVLHEILARYPGASSERIEHVTTILIQHDVAPSLETAATLRAIADLLESPIGDRVGARH